LENDWQVVCNGTKKERLAVSALLVYKEVVMFAFRQETCSQDALILSKVEGEKLILGSATSNYIRTVF